MNVNKHMKIVTIGTQDWPIAKDLVFNNDGRMFPEITAVLTEWTKPFEVHFNELLDMEIFVATLEEQLARTSPNLI